MAVDVRAQNSSRQTSATTAYTPTLALLTGTLDPVWQLLDPAHRDYPGFRWAFMWQDELDYGQHLTWWQTHLHLWPRKSTKLPTTGLKARHAALWLRAGYSQAQIADALGYGRASNVPKSLWRRANDYLQWLGESASKVRPDSLEAVAALEDMFALGAEIQAGRLEPGEHPYVLNDPALETADDARRYVRRKWRTPRVVTVPDWEQQPFAWPESISTHVIYGEVDQQVIARAEQRLCEQVPYHAESTGHPARPFSFTATVPRTVPSGPQTASHSRTL